MAETGIKISNLPQLTSVSNNDYMPIVRASDGITYRTSVSNLQSQINPSSSNVNGRITALESKTNAISSKVDLLSAEISALPNNFLSSSFKSMLTTMNETVNGIECGNIALKNAIDTTNANFQNLNSSLSALANNADIIDDLISVLTGDSGEVSLTALARKVTETEESVSDLQDKVAKISDSAIKAEALVKDSTLNFYYTRLNNVPTIVSTDEHDFNPICVDRIERLSTQYNFYYDRNRFANVQQPEPITYMISGNASYYEDGELIEEPSATYFEATSPITGTYLSTVGISVVNCSPISGEGISADHNVSPPEYCSVILTTNEGELIIAASQELAYPGSASFDIDAGIPLRYGMMDLISNDVGDTIIEARTTLSMLGNCGVRIMLNNSSLIDGQNKSIVSLKVDGKTVAKKLSKENADEIDDELEQAFDARLSSGSTIEFSIAKLKDENENVVDLSSISNVQESISKYRLFGAIVPAFCPSQANPIEFAEFKIDSRSEDTGGLTTFRISETIKGGFVGKQIALMAYQSEIEDNLSDLTIAKDLATSVQDEIHSLTDYAVNRFSFNCAPGENVYVRAFVAADGIETKSELLRLTI